MKLRYFILALLLFFVSVEVSEAATLSQVRTRVREYLYETDEVNSIYSNTMLNEAISQAQLYVIDVLPVSANYNMLTTASISLSSGVDSYSLPADFRRMVALKVGDKQATLLKPEEYFNKALLASSKDIAYCVIGSKIVISPAPTSSGTAILLYMKQPAALSSDSATLTTLPEFDTPVMLAAVQYILFSDSQTVRVGSLTNEIIKQLKAASQKYDSTTVLEAKPITGQVSTGETK